MDRDIVPVNLTSDSNGYGTRDALTFQASRVFIDKALHTGLHIKYHPVMNHHLSYEEKKELPDSMFGLPERREYPMPDAAHVRAAEAYFRYCPEELKPRLARAILSRAKAYGVDVESPTVLSYAEKQDAE